MSVDEVQPGARITGLASGSATVVAVSQIGDALQLTLRYDNGQTAEELIFGDDLDRLSVEAVGSRWSFTADGGEFRLASEALRMRHAGLADSMLAVETSNIDPLPHQIRTVYEKLLAQHGPLRWLIADDPGAGKTIMAALYLKELLLRGDVQRCLIVAPGGLVEQWQTELSEKFGLDFTILTRALADADRDGDPFRTNPMLIARMDQLARDEDWREALDRSEWDLIVVDEAHRMSAHWYSGELTRTRRYELGEDLGRITRHLLLMTATPHAGSEADFQAFLALLDPDRFAGQYRQGAHSTNTEGLMSREIKEHLVTFDGKPLFPERIAETVEYDLSPLELQLYEQVSEYVRVEMNRADTIDDGSGRRRTVGFALTVLQRRLASSPEAIYQSLRRRSARLRVHREQLLAGAYAPPPPVPDVDPDLVDNDEYAAEELEEIEDEVVDAATAARTVAELDAELASLGGLEELAARVRASGEDRKWQQLRTLVLAAHDLGMQAAQQAPNKLIIFTEHRDTLLYLQQRLGSVLGNSDAVVIIDGKTARQERRRIRERFTHDPTCQVLIATDAAGEGLNLQAAHLMVNYDLPWNPNRIEQRFGRIHRIGQREVCRLWNLVAHQTREGQVFTRLLTKIEEQRRAYGGKVFDVLGENAFREKPLRDLLIEAVRYGDLPETRAYLDQVIDASAANGLEDLIKERSLATPDMSLHEMEDLRRRMAEARARRLQPHFVQAFVLESLRAVGGRVAPRERDRFELTHVPAKLRTGTRPIAPRYSRITFEPTSTTPPGGQPAELIAPGHPLMEALVDAILERYGHTLTQGAVMIDDSDTAPDVRLVIALLEELADGTGQPASRRFEYVHVLPDHGAESAGVAPFLDFRPTPTDDTGARIGDLIDHHVQAGWLGDGVEALAQGWAIQHGLPAHRDDVLARVRPAADRTRRLVRQRLREQINHWDAESARLAEDQAAGRKVRISPATAHDRARNLEARLEARMNQIDQAERIIVRPPQIVAAALVISGRLLSASHGTTPASDTQQPPLDTTITERRAVDAVLATEQALGRQPTEMAHNNKGYDIQSIDADGTVIFIEVKGRVIGAEDFTVTVSEVGLAKNVADTYRLALVAVDPEDQTGSNDQVRYLVDPFRDLVLDAYTKDLRRQWHREWQRGLDPC